MTLVVFENLQSGPCSSLNVKYLSHGLKISRSYFIHNGQAKNKLKLSIIMVLVASNRIYNPTSSVVYLSNH